jgi:hypothetical protein
MSAPAATAGGARRRLAPLASCATARRTCSGVASQTGAPICGYPALQLAFPSAADGHGFLTGRRGLASELTARAGSAGGGLLPCLTCLALDAPGQLSCLVPCSGLRLCPGRELFRRRAELLAAPLDLLFQLLRVTGSCRLGIGLRVRFQECDQLMRVLLVCRWLATLPARRQAVPRDGLSVLLRSSPCPSLISSASVFISALRPASACSTGRADQHADRCRINLAGRCCRVWSWWPWLSHSCPIWSLLTCTRAPGWGSGRVVRSGP